MWRFIFPDQQDEENCIVDHIGTATQDAEVISMDRFLF